MIHIDFEHEKLAIMCTTAIQAEELFSFFRECTDARWCGGGIPMTDTQWARHRKNTTYYIGSANGLQLDDGNHYLCHNDRFTLVSAESFLSMYGYDEEASEMPDLDSIL